MSGADCVEKDRDALIEEKQQFEDEKQQWEAEIQQFMDEKQQFEAEKQQFMDEKQQFEAKKQQWGTAKEIIVREAKKEAVSILAGAAGKKQQREAEKCGAGWSAAL
jgi:cell division septum initiation protein DivIVA